MPRRSPWPITASRASTRRSCASSTPTARACAPTTDARSPRSCARRSPTGRITVFGDGSQTRSFCFVSDLIRGLIALAESGYHDPVNIGNPDEYTLLELAEAVKRGHGGRLGDPLRGAPGGRSQAAPTRHHARARAARVGPGGHPAAMACVARSTRPASSSWSVERESPQKLHDRSTSATSHARASRAHVPSHGLPTATSGNLDCCEVRDGSSFPGRAARQPSHAAASRLPAPGATTSEPAHVEPAPAPRSDRDVRSKRPPALSFLLRMDTMRRALRVVSLLLLDLFGVSLAIFTALALKAALLSTFDACQRLSKAREKSSPSPTCSPRCCSRARGSTPSARSAPDSRASSDRSSRSPSWP